MNETYVEINTEELDDHKDENKDQRADEDQIGDPASTCICCNSLGLLGEYLRLFLPACIGVSLLFALIGDRRGVGEPRSFFCLAIL